MPLVSVIVPVYKVELYIARFAHALFSQSLSDIEIIFVDDCSPDQSIAIIREVLENYPQRKRQVTILKTPQNGGLAKARLFGVKHAHGDYVYHLDSDDSIEIDACRLMYEMAVSNGFDVVTCDFRLLGLGEERIHSQACEPGREVISILLGTVWGSVCSRMFKRELWDNMIPPHGDMWEDMVFTIQALANSKNVGYIPIPLYLYYRRPTSISFTDGLQASLRRWTDIYANAQLIISFLNDRRFAGLNATDVIAFKYRCRSQLLPYVHIPEYYKKWRNTFPEIDREYLWARGISLEDKFWFVLIHLHLYHFVKMITGRLRRGN